MNDRIKFLSCLCISLAMHAVFFISLPCPQAASKSFLQKRPLEVSYQQAILNKKTAQRSETKIQLRDINKSPQSNATPNEEAILSKNKMASDLIKTDIFKNKPSLEITAKPTLKENAPVSKKMVSLNDIPGETAKTPEYKSYYQIVREKIRRLAYYNYRKLERGEVFLTFALTSKGELIETTINEENTSKSVYLQDIAIKSIEEAAPYPEFPEKLKKNPRLTFNVIISFELK